MIKIVRTDSDDKDFRELVAQLDEYLAVIDGAEHSFYAQFNKLDKIRNAVVAFDDETAVGCGAFKEYEPGVVEIKRMFVRKENRRGGVANFVLAELESWAKELRYEEAVLETGARQIEAVAFYKKSGYEYIPNYGQYAGVENSVCMRKIIA